MNAYRILGITDETTICECCGRTNLKKTVVITDGAETFRFGSECAAKRLKTTVKCVAAEVKSLEQRQARQAEALRQRLAAEEARRWESFLAARCPGSSTFDAIKALGGFAAARALYRAA